MEDLITLRALRYLQKADHIFAPNNRGKRRAYEVIKDFIDEEKVIFVDFPMGEAMKAIYEKTFDVIDRTTKDGELSVFITLGDGTIYATLIEVLRERGKSDIALELVPGIPAFLAGINALIESLVLKGESFLLLDRLPFEEDLKADTVAVLKAREPERLFEHLEKCGYDPLYLENIETDRWVMTDDVEKCRDRKTYMSLILARRRPWNMAEISKHIGGRIRLL